MVQQNSEPLHYRETETKPKTSVSRWVIELMVFFKDVLKLPLRNSNTGIPHLDTHTAVATTASDQNPPALGIFEGVRYEISDHLLEQARIAANREHARHHLQANSLRLGLVSQICRNAV